jgi:hypothetical protein
MTGSATDGSESLTMLAKMEQPKAGEVGEASAAANEVERARILKRKLPLSASTATPSSIESV